MIFDRNQSDVDAAINLRGTKVKKFIELTSAEITQIERGTITHNTLNRIENMQRLLYNLLNGYAYKIDITNKTNWTTSDKFTIDDFNRILNNTKALYNRFYAFSDTPKPPDNLFSWQGANSVEKILYDINDILGKMVSSFIYSSSDIYSGGV